MKVESRSFAGCVTEVEDEVPLPVSPDAAFPGSEPGGGPGGGPSGPETSMVASALWVLWPWLANRFFSSVAWSAVRLPLLT